MYSGICVAFVLWIQCQLLSTQKQPNCKKMWPMQKRQHEKSWEIKVGSPEVAVVV